MLIITVINEIHNNALASRSESHADSLEFRNFSFVMLKNHWQFSVWKRISRISELTGLDVWCSLLNLVWKWFVCHVDVLQCSGFGYGEDSPSSLKYQQVFMVCKRINRNSRFCNVEFRDLRVYLTALIVGSVAMVLWFGVSLKKYLAGHGLKFVQINSISWGSRLKSTIQNASDTNHNLSDIHWLEPISYCGYHLANFSKFRHMYLIVVWSGGDQRTNTTNTRV